MMMMMMGIRSQSTRLVFLFFFFVLLSVDHAATRNLKGQQMAHRKALPVRAKKRTTTTIFHKAFILLLLLLLPKWRPNFTGSEEEESVINQSVGRTDGERKKEEN